MAIAKDGSRNEANELPLVGISAATRTDQSSAAISIELSGKQVTSTILNPRRVWIEETQSGAHLALVIESAAGETSVRFRSAVLPEMVDGVVL